MKHYFFFAFSFFLSVPSLAQQSADRWTGFYLGPSAGIVMGKFSFSDGVAQFNQMTNVFVSGRGICVIPGTTMYIPGNSGSVTSFSGGIQLEYMKQFKHFVVGLESVINYSSFSRSSDYDSILPPTILVWYHNFGFHHTVSIPWMESIGLKLGYTIKKSMIYATAGKNFANLKIKTADYCDATYWAQPSIDNQPHPTPQTNRFVTSNNNATVKESFSPYCFGLGFEWALNDYLSVGVSFTHYKSFSIDFTPKETDTSTITSESRQAYYGSEQGPTQKIKVSENRVLLTLNINVNRYSAYRKSKKK